MKRPLGAPFCWGLPWRLAGYGALVCASLFLLAVVVYFLYGDLIFAIAGHQIWLDGAVKPLGLALLFVALAWFCLSTKERQTLWRRYGPGALALLFGLTLAFGAGEIAVRIAATYSPNVRYLATLGEANKEFSFPDLEAFLGSKPQIAPFSPHQNHWTNSLGFHDTEFEQTKKEGRIRIMSLGDSFTFGLVPYPDAVMTRLEEIVAADCPNVELYNFAIASTGLWDYAMTLDLAIDRYKPDIALVHIYLGNDGPSLFFGVDDIPDESPGRQGVSYLAAYLINLARIMANVEGSLLFAPSVHADDKRATEPVDPSLIITDKSPEMVAPMFEPGKWYGQIAANEISRFYQADKARAEKLWAPTLDSFGKIVARAKKGGVKLVFVFYPSAFQVYPQLTKRFFRRAVNFDRLKGLTPESVDMEQPARIFSKECEKRGVPCFDLTPALAKRALSGARLYRNSDTHWNIAGNRAAAEIEAPLVAKFVCPEEGAK